ncbi:Ubiquitin-like-specific protease 1D [Ananas comosus]|uniref:Ubiquitin-like-specific protease 1D n=1 Tax=Ananas comosus TaxID=4615 RepID=A0A199W0C8_ANACO|nr:Ubiquitin-like-specific protease 1D [Ananas comosus]
MARAPLKLDWGDLLPGRGEAPPPEVEVVASGGGGGGGGGASGEDAEELARLSDREIEERIRRLDDLDLSMSRKLRDDGEKLRRSRSKLQDALQRRRVIARDMKERAPSATGLGHLGGDKSRSLRIGRRISQLLTKTSSSNLSSKCSAHDFQQSISTVGCNDTDSEHFSRRDKNVASCNKRRKACNPVGSSNSDVQKAQEVVLLDDDDDVQPIESIEEDIYEKGQSSSQDAAVDLTELACTSGREPKIYYPSRNDPEAFELTYSDIKCLDPESYISSPIMNFYIQYLQRSLSHGAKPKGDYHIFNTYFYKKLEEALSRKGDANIHFQKLRRWWKGVNIFQKAYIFLPIHGHMHWSLIIICIPAKEDESGPIILHLDSLGLHPSSPIFNTVKRFLEEEWHHVIKNVTPDLPISERVWERLPSEIQANKVAVPQQKNEYDCGLFVLYFIERFIREAPERLRTEDLAMFGRSWFKPEMASELRQRIRKLLLEEFESSRLEGLAESNSSESDVEHESDS